MKTIKLQYDAITGEIRGYYPSDIHYDEFIKPFIDISEEQYNSVLRNEEKFRVQNKELIDISNTAEYQKEENKKLFHAARTKINEGAALAFTYGVINVREKYFMNVNWKEYYKYMQAFLERDPKSISLKTYNISEDNHSSLRYVEFSPEEALDLIQSVLSAIEDYQNQYVPNKQKELLAELEKLQKSNSTRKIRSFYENINYGLIIQD